MGHKNKGDDGRGKSRSPSKQKPSGAKPGRSEKEWTERTGKALQDKGLSWSTVTPRQLLQMAAPAVPAGTQEQNASPGEGAGKLDQAPTLNGATRPDVFGFEWKADGLYRIPADSNKTPFRVSGRFEVLALTRPEAGDEWGALLRWQDRDGLQHEWIMPFRLLAGEAVEVRARLAACGLPIGAHDGAQRALKEYLAGIHDSVEARVRTVPRTGWYRPASGAPVFVLPGRTIGASAGEVVRLDLDQAPAIYRVRGTLDGWRAELAALCLGNSRLAFAVATAFAGPIIGLMEDEGGGINFRGGSSKGKTSCIDAAASVWGAPSKTGPDSFTRTWRSTDNAMEATAAAHNDCILPLDELGQADPATLPETLYMLAHGAGKARARAGGGNRAGITWRTLVLSSSEESAARLMQQAKRRIKAGQEIRMLDIPAEVPGGHGVFEVLHGARDGAAFAQKVRTAVLAHHGLAGAAFAAELVELIGWSPDFVAQKIAPAVRDWLRRYVPAGADGQVERAGRRFALVAVAGELATGAGITGWPAGEAAGAAAVVFRAWMDERGGTGSREDHHLFAAFRRFFVEHGQARFAMVRDHKALAGDFAAGNEAEREAERDDMERERIVMHRAGWRWQEPLSDAEKMRQAEEDKALGGKGEHNNARWVYGLDPEVFEAEIAAPLGMERRDALARLGNAGLIESEDTGGERRWTIKKRRIPGVGRPRLIVPKAATLDD
jgi:putative DNA primase/helicase